MLNEFQSLTTRIMNLRNSISEMSTLADPVTISRILSGMDEILEIQGQILAIIHTKASPSAQVQANQN